jgi:hypothetical protein
MNRVFKLISVVWVFVACNLILFPCTVKAEELQPIKVTLELLSNNCLLPDVFEQVRLNLSGFSLIMNGINKRHKMFSEYFTSTDKSGILIATNSKPVRNDPRKASAYNTKKPNLTNSESETKYFHAVLFNIFTWIILPLLIGITPG